MNQMTEVRVLTPTEIASNLADLLTCEMLGVSGYSQRSAYDAKQEFDERVRELVKSGQLMAFAAAYEQQQLRAKCEGCA